MSISRVRIENYRSIENCEFYPKALCALVGENNSGKSNILQCLRNVLVRDWVTVSNFADEDFRDRNLDNDIVIELQFDPPLAHKEFAYADPVDIPILRYTVTHYKRDTKKAKAGERRLDTACLQRNGERVMVLGEAPKKGVKPTFKPLTSIPQEVKQQVPVIFVAQIATWRVSSQVPGNPYCDDSLRALTKHSRAAPCQ